MWKGNPACRRTSRSRDGNPDGVNGTTALRDGSTMSFDLLAHRLGFDKRNAHLSVVGGPRLQSPIPSPGADVDGSMKVGWLQAQGSLVVLGWVDD